MNDFYTPSGEPTYGSDGDSIDIRSEFESIEDGFDMLADLTGNALLPLFVNSGASGHEAVSYATARLRFAGLTPPSGVLLVGGILGLDFSLDTDADHDISFAAGTCWDSTNQVQLSLSAAMVKRLDATFVAGTGNGGLCSGTPAANTIYHFFVIQKTSDSSIDCYFDTDDDAANIPSGYDKYRWVGYGITDASANWRPFSFRGDTITFKQASVMAVNSATTVPAAFTAVSLSALIPSLARTNFVILGGQATSSGQGILLSTDGVYSDHTLVAENNNNGDAGVNAWGDYEYVREKPLYLESTDVYWTRGSFSSLSTAKLLLHRIGVRR